MISSMEDQLRSTLIKLLVPAAGIVVACIMFRRKRGASWREDAGLTAPRPGIASKSVTVPIAMHLLGNLISIWQSTH